MWLAKVALGNLRLDSRDIQELFTNRLQLRPNPVKIGDGFLQIPQQTHTVVVVRLFEPPAVLIKSTLGVRQPRADVELPASLQGDSSLVVSESSCRCQPLLAEGRSPCK